MRAKETPLIRDLPLFHGMADGHFEELMEAAYLQRFPPHVQLISEGDPADFLYLVVDGSVELYSRANDRETSMALVRPFETFILSAVLQDTPYIMSGRTIEASRILMVTSRNVRAAFAVDSAFARNLVQELSDGYHTAVRSLKNHKLRTAPERLANYLLRLHAEQEGVDTVLLPLEKRRLAALLGMTPENLSRAFATLRQWGVEISGREVHLRGIDTLTAFAKPDGLIDQE